jgi:murein DD-endopeptidase
MTQTTTGRIVAVAVAIAAVLGASFTTTQTATAAPATTYVGVVPSGTTIAPGSIISSPNGQFQLVAQTDGNLVEYGVGGAVLWASNTAGHGGGAFRLRTDGKLVGIQRGTTYWAVGTATGATALVVNNAGGVKLRDVAGKYTWDAGAFQDSISSGDRIIAGTVLEPSANAQLQLRMQPDGNLVQYRGATALWSTKTFNHPGASATVTAGGALTVTAPDGTVLWTSRTSSGDSQLLVQLDGNVVLYGSAGTSVWSAHPIVGLRWPVVSHVITGRFGDDRGPGHTPRYHQGADAGVPTGTTVYASGAGRVIAVTSTASYGEYVTVQYGNTTVLDAHMSKQSVKVGQIVSLGSVLGKSGATGDATGPHVHVEVRVGGVLKDPLTVLKWR